MDRPGTLARGRRVPGLIHKLDSLYLYVLGGTVATQAVPLPVDKMNPQQLMDEFRDLQWKMARASQILPADRVRSDRLEEEIHRRLAW